jgi:uncharacterized PurR-regulated membrane protein YhhQ (DUF165 family)
MNGLRKGLTAFMVSVGIASLIVGFSKMFGLWGAIISGGIIGGVAAVFAWDSVRQEYQKEQAQAAASPQAGISQNVE